MDEKLKSSSTKGQITHKRKVRNPPPKKKLSSLVSPGQMITFSLLVSKVDYATVSTLITRGKRGQRCYGRRSPVGVSTAGVSGLNSSLPPSFSLSLSHIHMLSCPSLNLCFIHPDSSSHTFLLFTHETPNSITVRVPWEADSGAAERHSHTQHVGQLHHGSDFTAGRATAQPSALFYVLITHQVSQQITREKEGQHMCCRNF